VSAAANILLALPTSPPFSSFLILKTAQRKILEKGDLLMGMTEVRQSLVVVRPVRGEDPLSLYHPSHQRKSRVPEDPTHQEYRHKRRNTVARSRDREDCEHETDESGPAVSHEYPGGGEIIAEKTEQHAGDNRVYQPEGRISRREAEQHEEYGGDHADASRQPVEPIDEIVEINYCRYPEDRDRDGCRTERHRS
jgi:hypothetical protein